MTRRRLGWAWRGALASLALDVLAGCGAHVLPTFHSESERLRVARERHDAGDCAEAIPLLKTYVLNAVGTAQVDEGIYLLGDCYLRTKEWTLAAGEFDRRAKRISTRNTPSRRSNSGARTCATIRATGGTRRRNAR